MDVAALEALGYVQNRLERDTEHRDETSLAAMMVQSGARYYLLDGDNVLLWVKDGRSNGLYCEERARRLGADMDRVILLGTDPDERHAPRLAAPLTQEAIDALEADPDYDLVHLRQIGLQSLLPPDQLGALAQARSLLFWHDNHPHCSRCGHKTDVALAGARRDCPSCGATHFPRTDPVVIMLAIHCDETGVERCLLGKHTRFQTPMFSTLAGFMEQGETMEAAVRREIFEEAGIHVGKVHYLTSQPWPFPASLMLGCYAEATSRDIVLDEDELSEARWFTREEVRGMMDRPVGGDLPHIPGPFAIASSLIHSWVAAEADGQ